MGGRSGLSHGVTVGAESRIASGAVAFKDFPAGSVVYEGVGEGWPGILCSLKTLLETGEPLAYLPG